MTTSSTSKRVFITGGASGLGLALATNWAKSGARVCIGDLDVERTEKAAREIGAGVKAVVCDVRKFEDVQRVADELQREWGGVDVVVNNAGVASAGPIEDIPLEEWHRVVSINLMGVVHGCKAFVPMLKRQGSGHIVNTASMAGLVHVPMMSTYNATKAAVVALSDTLRGELAPSGILVSVVCPSFFKTNLAESLAKSAAPEVVAQTQKLVAGSKISADSIAAKVVKAVARGEFLVLTHNDGAVVWMLKRLAPYSAYAWLLDQGAKRLAPKVASPSSPASSPASPASSAPPA